MKSSNVDVDHFLNVCISDLDKLNFVRWFSFKLKPILATAAPKIVATFQSGQIWPKNTRLANFIKIEPICIPDTPGSIINSFVK